MLISVVVPCYNVEPLIPECLNSVLAQTYEEIEIICVDDGSADGTLQLLQQFEREYAGRVRVLSGPNAGAAAARNRGLAISRGEYVQFLDADDLLDPAKLTHQANLLRACNPRPDLVVAAYRQIKVDGSERAKSVHPDPWIGLLTTRLGITSSNLWRRSAVDGVGGWTEGMRSSQESELMFRMLRHGASLLPDPECLTTIRKRENSISTGDMGRNWERWLQLRSDMLKYLSRNALLTEVRRREASRHVFNVLRMLHGVDPAAAVRMDKALRRAGAEPPTELGRLYRYVHRVLGIRWAERLHALRTQSGR